MIETRYTAFGVRMRLHSVKDGRLNWLLLPGGPGIGSESLHELADAMHVPGSIWLVDLPGDSSNTAQRYEQLFALWPQVLTEAAENLTALAVASAEWNFTPAGLEAGRALLSRMPYNSAAVEWSDAHFDHRYTALWWPSEIPVLRPWGDSDRIVTQRGWDAAAYNTPNVMLREIAGAGHFPWIEIPLAVRQAFQAFSMKVLGS